MISEESLRIMRNNADDVRKRLADIQTSLGIRAADTGQQVGGSSPDEVKIAVYNLTHIVLELAVAIGELQGSAANTLSTD